MNEILLPVLIVAGIGLLCGLGLAIASIVMAVPKDEKAEAIEEILPGANCGACGYSGCAGYAKALSSGEAPVGLCSPGGAAVAAATAELLGVAAGEAERRAKEMLDYFRLQEELWDIYPQTFSGGERLRLNLAHAMVKRPRLMLLDEPTASLDNKTKVLVKDILQQLKEEKTSMLGIFHDLEFMEGVCDKVFNMSEGSFA